MWWQVVFWILLIPLIIVEIIIFLKSRKFFWLIYALSIFTYVISVSYTIDVFELGRNSVILILLASAVLMFFIGRQLGQRVQKQEKVPAMERNIVISIAAIMIIIFVVSVIFGKAADKVTAVESIKQSDIVKAIDYNKPTPYEQNWQVTVLTRTLTNKFFLPVPVTTKTYMMCLITDQGIFNLQQSYGTYVPYDEISPGETKSVNITVQPWGFSNVTGMHATEVRIYMDEGQQSYAPCESRTQPDFVIPVR